MGRWLALLPHKKILIPDWGRAFLWSLHGLPVFAVSSVCFGLPPENVCSANPTGPVTSVYVQIAQV